MSDPEKDNGDEFDGGVIHEAILRDHQENPHADVKRGAIKAHLIIHGMVEKQLAADDPPEVSQALERLMAGGRNRHEAIHAIGEVVLTEAVGMMRGARDLDRRAYLTALRKLGSDSEQPEGGD